MKDPVLAEMHAITIAQQMTLWFGKPMEQELMLVCVPLARRILAGEKFDNWPWEIILSLPLRFLDIVEEGD